MVVSCGYARYTDVVVCFNIVCYEPVQPLISWLYVAASGNCMGHLDPLPDSIMGKWSGI